MKFLAGTLIVHPPESTTQRFEEVVANAMLRREIPSRPLAAVQERQP